MSGIPGIMWFWSSSTPAPRSGRRNAFSQSVLDGPGEDLSWDHPNYTGAATVTTSTLLDDTYCGKIVVCASSSPITITLPAAIPFWDTNTGNWWVRVLNIGSGTVTIDRNGRNINGGTINPTLTNLQGAIIDTDNSVWFAMLMALGGGGGGLNGVLVKTSSYPAVAGDSGKLIMLNGASVTLTLPNPPPSATWFILTQNMNSSPATVDPNGLTLDGSASTLTRNQNEGCIIATDGVNYFTERGNFAALAAYATIVGIQKESYIYAADSGVANAYVVALSPAITSYVDGQIAVVKIAHANTAASTLDGGGGAVAIKKKDGATDLVSGDLKINQIAVFVFGNSVWQMLSPSGTSAPGVPGGSDTQVQYDNAGVFGGITGATTDGTNLSVTTQAPGDNTTKAASDGFVQAAVAAGSGTIRKVGITIWGSEVGSGGFKCSQLDYAGTIIGWSIEADQAGSISVAVEKHAGTQTVPVVTTAGDKISASAPIALASAQTAGVDATGVSTWTTAVAKWDSIGFRWGAGTTLTWATLWLRIQL